MAIWQDFINLIISFLVTLYGMTGNFGVAIIILTIIVRLIFLPLSVRSTRSMKEMAEGQAKMKPHLEALKKKYGNDRQRLLEEQQKLYKEHNINPMAGMGGCLPLLIQMPIWIALYSALLTISQDPAQLNPGGDATAVDLSFLWIANLAQVGEGVPYLLTAFTGISQWAIAKMSASSSADAQAKTMNTMMQLTMPLMMIVFAMSVPVGLVLYWATTNIFQFFQQLFTTGWGDLWPSRSKNRPALASATASRAVATVAPPVESEVDVAPPATAEVAGRNGRGNASPRAVAEAALLGDRTPSTEKNGLRIYTLEPETDGGGDYTAEEASRDMDESIARAKGQQSRPKRKRRK